MGYALGIDVGGTSIKAGIFTLEGDLEATKSIPTDELTNEAAFADVTSALTDLIGTCGAKPEDIVALGLDVPGPVNAKGEVGFFPNIKLDAPRFERALKGAFPKAVTAFINDANAAALGEMWMGAAKLYENFVMLTLGTGVGGGIVTNGQLVAGHVGAAGELGHLTMNPDETETCGCGRKGCLEQYASASGIVRLYKQACEVANATPCPLSGRSDSYAVFQAMGAGDPQAKWAISSMLEYLARAMANIACVVDPECFVIGGGVVGSFDVFKDELKQRYQAHCLSVCKDIKIVPATLGNQAGMYGAAMCALDKER